MPNIIARTIVEMSKAPSDKSFSKNIKHELRTMKQIAPSNSEYSQTLNESEIHTAISSFKTGKAAGIDGIYYELIKNFGTNENDGFASFIQRFWILIFYQQNSK